MSIVSLETTTDIAALEEELALASIQVQRAEETKKALEEALKKKRTSDKQREQRRLALEAAGRVRRERHARKLAGLDTGEPKSIHNSSPNNDIGWGLAGLADELNCTPERAGYLFRSGRLGDAVWKLGARTICFSRAKLAALPHQS
jgi:hypothetical protein